MNIEINNEDIDIKKILLYSVELSSNYDDWINNENICEILNSNKNSLFKLIKYNNSNLCDKSVNCIIIAFYIHMYMEINKLVA
jgi:hypothetical protein